MGCRLVKVDGSCSARGLKPASRRGLGLDVEFKVQVKVNTKRNTPKNIRVGLWLASPHPPSPTSRTFHDADRGGVQERQTLEQICRELSVEELGLRAVENWAQRIALGPGKRSYHSFLVP